MRRVLREYSRVAWNEHMCDLCGSPILPGDYYDGIVQVDTYDPPRAGMRKRFHVGKYHNSPYCPDDFFDLEKEFLKEEENVDEAELEDDELPRAA
ncbi:MAG: hypothetical protein RL681_182 [Candidatus Parcubacteria bacterium]|jgi:hypothetical protein